MKLVEIDIRKLKHDPNQVRLHSERNIEAIKVSLEQFGQQKPIVVGKGNVVIAGNGTLDAARALGWKTIQAIRTKLKDARAIAYAIADNRTAELAEWDVEGLLAQLDSLKTDTDLDSLITGFSAAELDDLLRDLDSKKPLPQEDEVPEPPETPITKPGDLWQLGEHRLLCGDATSEKDVRRLLGDVVPVLMVTDPPYGVKYDPAWRQQS